MSGNGKADRLRAEVAAALEADDAVLPWLPDLLADLPDLSGGGAAVVPDVLAAHGFPAGGRVVDLGCGRGEVAHAVAQRFGARVLGVDGFAPFVAQARDRAVRDGVGDLCSFVHGDLRDTLKTASAVDAVLMIAVGPVLGDAAATVAAIRRAVRPGGLMVIDDAVLIGPRPPGDIWATYADRPTTEAALTAHGDTVLEARTVDEAMRAYNRHALTAMAARVADLSARHPQAAPILHAYLERQREEVAILEGGAVQAVVWVLRRALSP